MFSISLSLFVILYAIFVLLTFVFAAINIYHLVSTGMLNLMSFSFSALIVLLMFVVLGVTGIYISTIDTTQAITLFGNLSEIPTAF